SSGSAMVSATATGRARTSAVSRTDPHSPGVHSPRSNRRGLWTVEILHMLTDTDDLASLERKLHLVRDLVTAVARGYHTGLYLYGTGGGGKSFAVTEHLKRLDVPYRLYNSRMTAKGLFKELGKAPDAVFVLEDMERMVTDRDAQGVLRSALWAQPGH